MDEQQGETDIYSDPDYPVDPSRRYDLQAAKVTVTGVPEDRLQVVAAWLARFGLA
ncbi:hypothetical protein HNO88_002777 [Novosphingobium chloroacetimidivorans]|uniref:Uncharacterized protein n=1 Tax=Novosphingobium chloroacetimidivorans TaxID=1428314 RepID=A0A7W7NWD6_9SPHN|nr:hypothetical protein [Novosphingobium chloroacetimidivorans]MBB4859448.1 hypothetical protein [Novosphingobium chloroacetimidivorans]